MHHRLIHRFPRDISRTGLISGRLLVAVAMLFGMMTLGLQGTSAQSDPGFEYDENGLSWSVDYDDSVWTEADASQGDFSLESSNGSVALFVTLPDVNTDPAGCLAVVVPEFEDGAGITDSSPLEGDSGDPVAGETDAYAYSAQTVESDALSGETVHACYALDDASVLWAVTLVPDGADDLDDVYALYDGISIAGEPTPIGLPDGDASGSTGDDATPVASDDTTPEASDAGTPAGDGTPAANGGTPAATTDGAYTSPTFGYTLSFPPDDWTVDNEAAASDTGGRDIIYLSTGSGTSLLYVEGSEEWSDPADCVSVLLEEIGVDPAAETPAEDPDTGDPYEISEDDRSAVAYTASEGGEGATVLVDCRQDEGSDVIVGFTSLSEEFEDYFGVDYPAVEEILDSLEF